MTDTNFKALELDKILLLLANECSNTYTKELAMGLAPQTDIAEVSAELSKTAEAFSLSVKYGSPEFYDFPNMDASVDKAKSGGELSAKELLDINRILKNTDLLISWRSQHDDETKLDGMFEMLFDLSDLSKKITLAIISEEEIADEASSALAAIRKSLIRQGAKLRDGLEGMLKSSSVNKYLQDNIVTIRDGRYVLPVKAEYKGNVPGLVHDTSSSGATVFIEPMQVVEANNEIAILKGKEQEEIHRILKEFSAQIGALSEQIKSSFKALVRLNLYFAKANLAAKMNAGVPELTDDGRMILKKARHPLIDREKVVPIDFSLGDGYRTLIVTGPNTGGKTVILKTVGLMALMTMCGLMIPVSDGSVVSVFNKILVDIGDNQSIENDLSTFSSHISNVNKIINKADEKSLVLLDEIGSGTDPVEGAALAVAMTEKLRTSGAAVVITTHYQELKLYALDTDGVQNASCEFDVKTLSPTYKLIIGTPGRSNAFEISKRLGVCDEIIDYAKSLLNDDSRRFENILDALESARIDADKEREAARKLKLEAQEQMQKAEEKFERLEKDRENIISQARNEASAILKRVTRESDALIDELDKVRRDKNKANFESRLVKAKAGAKASLDRIYESANPKTRSATADKHDYKKGDSVVLVDTNTKGTILSAPDSNGMCLVQAGIMKTKISASKLRPDKTEKVTIGGGSVSKKGIASAAKREAKMELDIRGYMVDEGLFELDSFLDSAVMAGIGMVTIIHGKGTGALKNAVRKHLKNHKQVKSFRRGMFGEGEDGVTVVELK